jgi:hypothetical protein
VADADAVLGPEPPRQVRDDREEALAVGEPLLPLERVHGLDHPVALHELAVVGRVPELEDLRGQVVALHEQPAGPVRVEVHGADHAVAPSRSQPPLGRREQSVRGLGIVIALEEAPQAPPVALELVEAAVDVRGDPPHRLGPAPGQEELGLGVLEEGVATGVQRAPLLGLERRDPPPLGRVDSPRQPDEPRALRPRADRTDLHRHGARPYPSGIAH